MFGSAAVAQEIGAPVQQVASTDSQLIEASAFRPGSPSNGTATISPSSVPQSLERMEVTGGNVDLSLGSLYASGDFGTSSNTSIWSSAVGARVRLGDWRLTASLPWMRIRSRSTIFTGIDSTPVLVALDTSPVKRTNDGFGDLTLGAAYTIASEGSPYELELSARAKLNTATRSSRLSSGENDYAVGAQLTRNIGAFAPFASVTYRFLGDTNAYRLRDGFAASAGGSVLIGSRSFVLASYHYSRAATRLVGDAHELFAGASTMFPSTKLRLTGFGTVGLSHGAAGVSAGIALSLGFGTGRLLGS